jgi:hypothetical protein
MWRGERLPQASQPVAAALFASLASRARSHAGQRGDASDQANARFASVARSARGASAHAA